MERSVFAGGVSVGIALAADGVFVTVGAFYLKCVDLGSGFVFQSVGF